QVSDLCVYFGNIDIRVFRVIDLDAVSMKPKRFIIEREIMVICVHDFGGCVYGNKIEPNPAIVRLKAEVAAGAYV
ncbi:MAG TPA: hypothetical protein PKW75_04070, partial [candidate division Zixibacteria bacterium]|nr:hypothetical protein [candidate division Zixibacteria bacterium]